VTVVDTHVVLWLTQDQSQLSPAAIRGLSEARQQGSLAIADITLREIAVQIARGRVAVSSPAGVYLRFIETLFTVLPINAQIAERSAQFGANFPKDPADRLIAATTLVHGARLVTKDEEIRGSGEVTCIW
jgi:PIN domain nuclease of toxin-antitoxin system